ncbi:MAG TPA: biotin carboxylase N-terminal domain-containing protein [Candidatus Limnocylindrales bacterium]|nr:biotin carboxylase N-terminal domain-containing protein [Candidatus Limnocylindrales bacterium]
MSIPVDTPTPPITSIRTVFIANRGEIAIRIRRTTDRLGIRAVAPPTDGPGAVDLLSVEGVVAAARAAGADALHPGFGFLAESPELAEAVTGAGIRWIGPPAAAIRAMGDKAAARRLAAALGVPIVPGYDGVDQSDEALAEAAKRIGRPLLVKPAAGGGGKGMRVVRSGENLGDTLASSRREARAAFGDDRLVLERLVENARHVEVQVLFDGHGRGIHLGERDCSIQRRHQKVLEETPSPAVDAALRRRLTDAALALAGSVGYVSAGTCEFLLDDQGAFYFLEMNTRLQVEHPVTEAVTGRDLVADQIRIAAGEPLRFEQVDVGFAGHAIEARLYAEDPDHGFLPATGRIARLVWPIGPGIRVDSGVAEGTTISDRFDPMLAKIVAHGATRAEALRRLATALDETLLLGVTTNLRFLRWLVRRREVTGGEARIDTLDRIWPAAGGPPAAIPDDAWAAAAAALGGGWRLNAPPLVRIESDGAIRSVDTMPPTTGTRAWVRAGDEIHVDVDGRSVAFTVAPPPDVDRAARSAAAHGHAGGPVDVTAPMPGSVVSVHIAAGASVDAGDPIATLEAMKMEHAVTSPILGVVTELRISPGDQVARGQLLATLDPDAVVDSNAP